MKIICIFLKLKIKILHTTQGLSFEKRKQNSWEEHLKMWKNTKLIQVENTPGQDVSSHYTKYIPQWGFAPNFWG